MRSEPPFPEGKWRKAGDSDRVIPTNRYNARAKRSADPEGAHRITQRKALTRRSQRDALTRNARAGIWFFTIVVEAVALSMIGFINRPHRIFALSSIEFPNRMQSIGALSMIEWSTGRDAA